jgi:membrane associated rhomboid family serine protease
MENQDVDKKRLLLSMIFPLLFIALLWTIKIIEVTTSTSFVFLGLYPLKPEGLIGILTGPLIHGDWKHLFSNTFPLFFLSWAIFYFYQQIAWKVILLAYFISQFWLWFFAREAWHIGASGLIYAFGSFIFVSGIIRKNRHLLAISLLVAFIYGSMVWGIFPTAERISWEGHLMGMIAGIILAFYYKSFGPPLPESQFIDDEEGYEEINFEETDPNKS